MDYKTLKSAIASVIKQNGNQEITGSLLQSALLTIIDSLGAGHEFAGVASGATIPPAGADSKLFYLAGAGTYTNFNGLVVNPGELGVFFNSEGNWYKQTINIASAGYTLYSDSVYTYGSLPAKPADGGLYYIFVDRVSSNVKYRYIYTSNPSVNSGDWKIAFALFRWRLASGETSSAGNAPVSPTSQYMTSEIKSFLNSCCTMFEGTVFQGGIPASWSGTRNQFLATGCLSDQELETLESVAAGVLPWVLSIDRNYATEKLTLLYRYEEQDHCKLIFGNLDADDYGSRMTFIIGNEREGNDSISFFYEHYQD